MSKLEELKKITTVVCDTGDINSIKKYAPQDATTNPSLIFQAAQDEEYAPLVNEAISYGEAKTSHPRQRLSAIMDKLFVNFGVEILKIVPGRVSTEVDARLSYDTQASIHKATSLISLYERAGIDRKRVLIKLASTWEGVCAAKYLENEGIHCNMTLMFSLPQAIACAEAKATLISPFVGRILDWHKAQEPSKEFAGEEDPGVQSVKKIYQYYKKFGYKTEVMGASFRNIDEILNLAGCDLLTIAPKFLQTLSSDTGHIERKLDPKRSLKEQIDKIEITEQSFRYLLNDDGMAYEKLGDGIRRFAKDTLSLEKMILDKMSSTV